jgi:hypothetical protein
LGLNLLLANYTNNKIYFTNNVNNFVGTIASGVYDITTFLQAVKTAMESSRYGGTVIVTFSDLTYKLTINSSTSIFFQWGTFTSNFAYNLLGFLQGDTIFGFIHTADNSLNLSIPSCFFIYISQFPVMCRNVNNVVGTFPVYTTGNSGDISFLWERTHYELESTSTISSLNQLHIQLIDPRTGRRFDINNIDWAMLLELQY